MNRWRVAGDEERCLTCGSRLEVCVEARNGSQRPSAERCPRCGYRQALVRLGDWIKIEKCPLSQQETATSSLSIPTSPLRKTDPKNQDKFGYLREGWL